MTATQKTALLAAGKRREFWLVGPEYTDSEKEFRVIYNILKRLKVPFDKPGTYYDALGGNMHISCFDGTFQVHAKSAKHPDTLIGEGLSGVILCEAAKLKSRVWFKFIRPTLADYKGWALFSSTPEGKNWFYELWAMGQNPQYPDWASWKCPSWVNDRVFPAGGSWEAVERLREHMRQHGIVDDAFCEAIGLDPEIAAMAVDLTDEAFNQEVGADFSEFVGRVFKEWDEEVHVKDIGFQPGWDTYACTDYGFTNPFVWLLLQVDPHKRYVNVLDEYYEYGVTPEEAAEEIKVRGLAPAGTRLFYPDPASPGDSKMLSEKLKIGIGRGTGGERKDRYRAIRNLLKPWSGGIVLPVEHPEARPRILVSRRCPNLIREMDAFRYPEKRRDDANNPEEPLKKDDHTPEALSRFVAGHLGTPRRAARQSIAKVG